MPFTVSHAAVVWPFARRLGRHRVLSAAVIGSMVPDFGMFLPWRLIRWETHSAIALVSFCLPMGLASYWIFQRLVRTPMLELLPEPAYARACAAPAPDLGSLRQWLYVTCGILLGAVSHLVWDGFTHEGARGVRMIPALDDPMIDVAGHHLLGFKLMQHASSLLGLAMVLWWASRSLRVQGDQGFISRPLGKSERQIWLVACGLLAAVVSVTWFITMRAAEHQAHGASLAATDVAVAGLRGLVTSLVVVSLALQVRLRVIRAEGN